jgi:hypothetical protein
VTQTATTPQQTPPRKRSLFDIGSDFEALEALLGELDGDISDPQAQVVIEAWFAEVEHDLSRKADGYIWLIRKWESEQAVAKEESERMRQTAKCRENRITSLKLRMFQWMDAHQRAKIETECGRTIAVQGNGGKQGMNVNGETMDAVINCAIAGDIQVDTVAALNRVKLETINAMKPYLKARVYLDVDAIRATLETGGTLPFAELLPRGKGIRIR